VLDDEVVVHAVFEHTPRDGLYLKQNAFSSNNLKRGEVSVARRDHTSSADFQRTVVEPQIARLGKFIGASPAQVSKLRRIKYRLEDETPPIEGRAVCIFSRVNVGDDTGHASLGYSITHAALTDNWKRKLRPIIAQDIAEAFEAAGSNEVVFGDP
jgi:hypothetical protein